MKKEKHANLSVEVPLKRLVRVVDQELLEVVPVPKVFEPCRERAIEKKKKKGGAREGKKRKKEKKGGEKRFRFFFSRKYQ